MATKPGNYAVLEGIQHEMRANKLLSMWHATFPPVAISPMGTVIDLGKEFGYTRVPDNTAIDEEWMVGASIGQAMSGVPSIAHPMSMTVVRAFDLIFNQAGKMRYQTAGQVSMPFILWQDASGRGAGVGASHADAGQESLYASIPGLKVLIPSDPYEAKGLMIAAIRSGDPVVYFHYGRINAVKVDVPDEPYEIKIGEAKLVQQGSDITIVGYGPAMVEINKAIPDLKAAGIKAEIIDPRSLKPLPIEAIAASVKKTGKLLTVDHGNATLCNCTEIIAQCAILVHGAKFTRLAFPDAPAPANRGMIEWMTPSAAGIVEAAKRLVAV